MEEREVEEEGDSVVGRAVLMVEEDEARNRSGAVLVCRI